MNIIQRLKGKIAIITGIASGIGEATAIQFAKEGATVIGVDINEKDGIRVIKEIQSNGGTGVFVKTDVSKSKDIDIMFEKANNMGNIDILVNNAGVEVVKRITETSEDEWDRTINVNLKSVFLTCKKVIPLMQKQSKGVIINNASAAAIVGSFSAVYSASKGGILSLTKALAVDYGIDNIRVNCILPGAIETPMLDRVNKILGNPEEIKKERIKGYPLGRFGNVDEIAQTIVFLSSDEASFITGASIVIDGGFSVK